MAWNKSNLLSRSIDKSNSAATKPRMDSQDNPPPYDAPKSIFSQCVDKLIDSTSFRFGYHLPSRAVDRKSLSQGIKLVEIAVDEFETGNEAIGLDVYLAGLDKIIMALPNLKAIQTKEALMEKLTSFQERVGIAAQQSIDQQKNSIMENKINHIDAIISKFYAMAQLFTPAWLTEMAQDKSADTSDDITVFRDAPIQKFKTLNRAMTDIIVHSVVLFKQSPIPGLLYAMWSYFLHAVFWINEQFQVIEKVEHVTIECIKFALKTDEKYHLHEFASDAMCAFVSLFLKAMIAYKEAPPPPPPLCINTPTDGISTRSSESRTCL